MSLKKIALVFLATAPQWALAQSSNFGQLRFFYPPEAALFGIAPALDVAFQFPIGETLVFGLEVRNTTLDRQHLRVLVAGPTWTTGVVFRHEQASELEGHVFGVQGVLAFTVQDQLGTPSPVRDAHLDYDFRLITGNNGHTQQTAHLDLSGDLTSTWNWTASYALDRTLALQPQTTHGVQFWLRTQASEWLRVGLGAGLNTHQQDATYHVGLEAALAVSEGTSVVVSAQLNSKLEDQEQLSVSTTQLLPALLTFGIGRSATSALNWQVGMAWTLGPNGLIELHYQGQSLGATDHAWHVKASYADANTSLHLNSSVQVRFDESSGLWLGVLRTQFGFGYRIEAFRLDAHAQLEYGPQDVYGRAGLVASYTINPWLFRIESEFRVLDSEEGHVAFETLYAVGPAIAVNLTLAYRWKTQPLPLGGFSAGLGLRYMF